MDTRLQISINTIIDYIIVTLLILNSKSVYFGIVYSIISKNILLLACGLLFLIRCRHISMKLLLQVSTLLALLLIGGIINGSILSNVRVFIVVFAIALIVVLCISKSKYIECYINIINIISIISLICFAIGQVAPAIASYLASYYPANTYTTYWVSSFYYWGLSGIYHRNCGIFWEPGAYQGFINIAILMLLLNGSNVQKKARKFIIFTITLLSTQSTTGYIVYAIIVIVFIDDMVAMFGNNIRNRNSNYKKVKLSTKVLVSIVVIFVIIFLSNTAVISDKLGGDSVSGTARLQDLLISAELFSNNMLFGLGANRMLTYTVDEYGVAVNSNGLFAMLYTFGAIFSIYYIYRFKKGIDGMFKVKSILKRIALYVIFIIIYGTEAVYWFPIYVVFLFSFTEKVIQKELEYKIIKE